MYSSKPLISAINDSDFILAMDNSNLHSTEMKTGPLKTHLMARMPQTRSKVGVDGNKVVADSVTDVFKFVVWCNFVSRIKCQ